MRATGLYVSRPVVVPGIIVSACSCLPRCERCCGRVYLGNYAEWVVPRMGNANQFPGRNRADPKRRASGREGNFPGPIPSEVFDLKPTSIDTVGLSWCKTSGHGQHERTAARS